MVKWIRIGITAQALAFMMLILFEVGSTATAAGRGAPLQGPWIVIEGRPAPWVADAVMEPLDESLLVGIPVEFWHSEVSSPSVLGCRDAHYERHDLPAGGLFRGNLPNPTEPSALSLGFSRFPVSTMRVTCSTGVYDYHQLNSDTLMIAVDNVIWTLVPARSTP